MENLIELVVGDLERSLEISYAVYDKKQPTWEDFNELRNTMRQCKETLESIKGNYVLQTF